MKPDSSHDSPPPRPGIPDLAPAHPQEHLEPGEAHRHVSLWYITLLCVFFGWAGFYLQRYSGNYGPLDYDENAAGGPKTNAVKVVDPYVLGQRIFANNCAKCHQPDGLGLPGQYPPLVKSEWVQAEGAARLIRLVLDGLQGPITVKGIEYNNVMTPWRTALTDAQTAAVLTFVRTQKEWGHTASPVTPEEVAAIRAKTKDRATIGAYTAAELLALPEHEPKP